MTVHVRVDDLVQPVDSSILEKVMDIYTGIGITLDMQFGSFLEEELAIHGNIQITTLSSKFDADDQKVAESSVRLLWKTPAGAKNAKAEEVVASMISHLSDPEVWGYAAGVSVADPLRSPIFVKAPPADWPQNEVFTRAYTNVDEANRARDLYYYTDVMVHELGHAFGLSHNSADSLDFMYESPHGQQKTDQIMEEILKSAPKDDLLGWREFVIRETVSRGRHFSVAEAKTARDTIGKFVK